MSKCKFYLNDRAKRIDWSLDNTGWVDGNNPQNVIKVIEDSNHYFGGATYDNEETITNIVDNILSGCYYWYGWTPTLDAIRSAINILTDGKSAIDKAWHFTAPKFQQMIGRRVRT